MAAKAAGVSFEKLNAAIQVLDKAGKRDAEGGVALRNTMAILPQGRFLPKDVQKELEGAIDVNRLGDKTITLADRLRLLQPVIHDSALFAKLFGRENANASMALVQGVDEIDRYKTAITGTNTAMEQAIIMDSYAERQSRIKAKFDNLKISLFNTIGDLGTALNFVTKLLIPLVQILPLIVVMNNAVRRLRNRIAESGGITAFLNKMLKSVFFYLRKIFTE